jgi:hypothetical protein
MNCSAPQDSTNLIDIIDGASILSTQQKGTKTMRQSQVELGQARNIWTAKDEAKLVELIDRKARVLEASREPLVAIISRLKLDHGSENEVCDWLIESADELRAALLPFVEKEV